MLYDITCMWNLKKKYKLVYIQNRNTLRDVGNKPGVSKRERRRGETNQGYWDKIQAIICNINKQQGYTLGQKEFIAIFL